ncbi:MAG: hypothetical protein U5L04_06375 [Trueperaceae bacterium]|nr:hypothetical protein [Trueperaceae bacterium]
MNGDLELNQLDPDTFEHMVNDLALRVLGPGLTMFAAGADGGRDGYFQGRAPYPSESEQWSGIWYIQSKFHKQHLSKDPQKWLLKQIKSEIKAFEDKKRRRKKPDNWIIATNVDPTGQAQNGSFDQANVLVEEFDAELAKHFHIWGGEKLQSFLRSHSEVAKQYGHFLTPGQVLSEIQEYYRHSNADEKEIIRYLVANKFSESLYAKLEQAGSTADDRPGVHELFVDVPFRSVAEEGPRTEGLQRAGMIMNHIVKAALKSHKYTNQRFPKNISEFNKHPERARTWFLRGGPGRGKSTIGQYFCQIQRASIILAEENRTNFLVKSKEKELAKQVKEKAKSPPRTSTREYLGPNQFLDIEASEPIPYSDLDDDIAIYEEVKRDEGYWTEYPRIPVFMGLQYFASWFRRQNADEAKGILSFLAMDIGKNIEKTVKAGTVKSLLSKSRWVFVFDGLDEVPNDIKDEVALEVIKFIDRTIIEVGGDVMCICSSRPQGYSGQFDALEGLTVDLVDLHPQMALRCAESVLSINRAQEEVDRLMRVLREAISSESVRELMKTPLQTHIMAVIVRNGGRPPERRWKLFDEFYRVIKKREADKDALDEKILHLLQQKETLLKTVHNCLGFKLHAKAEESTGAEDALSKEEFRKLVEQVVSQMEEDDDIEKTVDTVMEAATERLVLVNTPDDGDHYRFDVRQLQEFFAAEFMYDSVSEKELHERLKIIAGDAHWREVVHFLISALVEQGRTQEFILAVDTLKDLDSGEEELETFKKAMCKGSLIASRLLQEGVLDQDRKKRDKFSPVLEPLYSSFSIENLFMLTQTQHKSSKLWLTRSLKKAIKTFSPPGNAGAMIVMLCLPTEDTEVQEQVYTYLRANADTEHFDLIIQEYRQARRMDHRLSVGKGLLRFCIEKLLSDEFYNVNPRILPSLIDIVAMNKKALDNALSEEEFSLSPFQKALLDLVLSRNSRTPLERSVDVMEELKFMEIIIISTDLSLYESFIEQWKSEIDNELIRESSGIICVVYSVLLLYARKSREALYFLGREDVYSLACMTPIDLLPLRCDGDFISFEQLSEIKGSSDRLKKFLNSCCNLEVASKRELVRHYRLLDGREETVEKILVSDDWNAILKHWTISVDKYPGQAINFVRDNYSELQLVKEHNFNLAEARIGRLLKLIETLVDKLLKDESLLKTCPEMWGVFVEASSESKEQKLRASMKRVANDVNLNKLSKPRLILSSGIFKPFELLLPMEAELLPVFACGLLVRNQGPYGLRGSSSRVHKESPNFQHRIREEIDEIIPGREKLRRILSSSEQHLRVRAASLLFLLLKASNQEDRIDLLNKVPEIYEQEVGSWFLNSFINYLRIFEDGQVPEVQAVLGSMIAESDPFSKNVIEELLSSWREVSSMPVTRVGVAERWLDGASE